MFEGIRRPKPKEDEDDLLRLQEEYYAKKEKPAAKVVKRVPPTVAAGNTVKSNSRQILVPAVPAVSARAAHNRKVGLEEAEGEEGSEGGEGGGHPMGKKKRSIFAERRAAALKEAAETRRTTDGETEENAEAQKRPQFRRHIESADALFGKVLSNVSEKDPAEVNVTIKAPTGGGFPEVLHRSQRTKRLQDEPPKRALNRQQYLSRQADVRRVFGRAGDMGEEENTIHTENVARIESMTEEEIEEAQAEILSKLDPELVELLRKRAAGKYGEESGEGSGGDMDRAGSMGPMTDVVLSDSNNSIQNLGGRDASATKPFASSIIPRQRRPIPVEDWIPSDKAEIEKLEWMAPEQDVMNQPAEEQTASELRFDFKGRILDSTVEVPVHLGLHHHGNEPQHPGYSLDELLHLSRSTVPNQRSISLSILTNIVERVRAGAYGRELGEVVASQLIRKDLLLHVRIALDDSHDTVFINALEALAASVGCGSDSDDEAGVWDAMALTRQGYRTLAISIDSTEAFSARVHGLPFNSEDLESDDTLAAAKRRIQYDALQGLLSTNLLLRFRYLLDTRQLSASAVAGITCMLVRVCQHSRSAAADVARCQGLVEVVRNQNIRTAWPPPTLAGGGDVDVHVPDANAVKLMRVLCQSGRDVAESIVKLGIIDDVMRFVAINPAGLAIVHQDLAWDLQVEVWTLLGVVLTYGLSGRLFDDYRQLLLQHARSLLNVGDVCLHGRKVVAARIAFLRMLLAVSKSFGGALDVGGPDDALLPFVNIIAEKMSEWTPHDGADQDDLQYLRLEFLSAAADLVASYGDRLEPNTPASVSFANRIINSFNFRDWFNSRLTIKAIPLMETATKSCQTAQENSKATCPTYRRHWTGLHHSSRVQLAAALWSLTAVCDFWSSHFELVVSLCQLDPARVEDMANLAGSEHLRNVISGSVDGLVGVLDRGDWIRYFAAGRSRLFYSWVMAMHRLGTGVSPSAVPIVVSVALVGLVDLLPGDEYLAAKLLNTIILHHRYQTALAGPSTPVEVDESAHLARQILQDAYDRDMYSDAALRRSEGLYRGETSKIGALLMDLDDRIGGTTSKDGEAKQEKLLPVRFDWVYSPLQKMVDEGRKVGQTPDEGGDIVVECLKLIQRLETAVHPPWYMDSLGPAVKLTRLANVFLLPAMIDEEVFLRPDVADLTLAAISRYTTTSHTPVPPTFSASLDLDSALSGNGRFYRMYNDLLEQYTSCSFGDPAFTVCVLLPLSMRYPSDYRLLFWTQMADLYKTFNVGVSDVRGVEGRETYFVPVETDAKLVEVYVTALAGGGLEKGVSPFLYWVAVNHVCGFLFGEAGKEGEAERKKLAGVMFARCRGEVVRDVLEYRWDSVAGEPGRVSDDVYKQRQKLRESLAGK
ncbi:RNA polymerase II associated protein 1 [Borealophlyctis nickersoniae]|nr:RNA polymerase II associated protein 1 [Borealophlyctis nickersoniae]